MTQVGAICFCPRRLGSFVVPWAATKKSGRANSVPVTDKPLGQSGTAFSSAARTRLISGLGLS